MYGGTAIVEGGVGCGRGSSELKPGFFVWLMSTQPIPAPASRSGRRGRGMGGSFSLEREVKDEVEVRNRGRIEVLDQNTLAAVEKSNRVVSVGRKRKNVR